MLLTLDCVEIILSLTLALFYALGLIASRSMILLYSIIQPVWSPQTLGIIGIVMYYQKWYGTIMYLFQFFNNKRYQKLSWPEILLCVLFSNGIWVVFPMIGFYASVTMIYSNSYAIYQ